VKTHLCRAVLKPMRKEPLFQVIRKPGEINTAKVSANKKQDRQRRNGGEWLAALGGWNLQSLTSEEVTRGGSYRSLSREAGKTTDHSKEGTAGRGLLGSQGKQLMR